MTNPYASSGVDTEAGDRAVELMKAAVSATHNSLVLGGVGGFAGMIDAKFLKDYDHPILATSTDGVGTKVAIAQAIDKHDTIGQDLVGMVVDDIVVVGARSLFMTDYIATGKLEPSRIADIVRGIAGACRQVDVALVGGETAEHPGLLAPEEYDVAGAAVGVVEKSKMLSASRVQVGDVVLGLRASGLHSNGFSLVRKIVADRGLKYTDQVPEFSRSLGEELLEPTRLYTGVLNKVLEEFDSQISTMSHITGGGIAANLSRVLPETVSLDVERPSWRPNDVFSVLAQWANYDLKDLESTWNLGLGFAVVVRKDAAQQISARITELGIEAWDLGVIESTPCDAELPGYVSEAKGVRGGAVRLVGNYAS
ncbi:phosphoribosylformylglycinamidine cyclo-ligase [Aquiluna borgnonia]|uniref:Phosphoribosylformylglycinamidine cyclo-ligase n=1 Tax=Aquiluna borgnonia TaxID=2499157 RepID=A0A7D4TS43_9MICO|nr:phosphoribosylformylglycinamidine cyclo-ligase [Aquiluna borgnonia]QKJ25813.1 phosphoribosylformylglycinamidine cyclo-ligase [Aquiluna borgnonia]